MLNILEDDPECRLEVVLANAQQVKAVTGHKTDPHDARWLAYWLRHGMIRPSFIPPRAQRELRDLTRRRKQMVRAAAEERNRVQKVRDRARQPRKRRKTKTFAHYARQPSHENRLVESAWSASRINGSESGPLSEAATLPRAQTRHRRRGSHARTTNL